MCGRYYVDDDTARAIEKLVRELSGGEKRVPRGDICPGQEAPILVGQGTEIGVEFCFWGFPGFRQKGLIFNARSESAAEKRMFGESVRRRRCAVLAGAFYEWSPSKEKHTFRREDGEMLYLAGVYNRYKDQDHFVILTTEPNASVERIHNRMPLVLEPRQVREWILDEGKTEYLLGQRPVELKSETDYEQQTLNFK